MLTADSNLFSRNDTQCQSRARCTTSRTAPGPKPPLRGRPVRDEIRANLLARLGVGRPALSRHRRVRGHDPPADRQRAAGPASLHPARPAGPGQEPNSPRAHLAAGRADPDRRRQRGERRSLRADLQVRPRPAGRVRRRDPDRLAAPRPALRREAGDARRDDRRPHRRRRSRSRPRAAATCCPTSSPCTSGCCPAPTAGSSPSTSCRT